MTIKAYISTYKTHEPNKKWKKIKGTNNVFKPNILEKIIVLVVLESVYHSLKPIKF